MPGFTIHTTAALMMLGGLGAALATALHVALAIGAGALTGTALAWALRRVGLRWTWALTGTVAVIAGLAAGATVVAAGLLALTWRAARIGHRADRHDRESGGDLARAAAARLGVLDAVRIRFLGSRGASAADRGGVLGALSARLLRSPGRSAADDGLVVGHDAHGVPVRIPLGGPHAGAHALIVAATGAGKTVTQAWILGRLIEMGSGCIGVDPKGDDLLYAELADAARRAGRPFFAWTPDGPCVYNPLAHGSAAEIADKALSGERFTEPHYLRQAQRYLGHAARVLLACGVEPSLAALVAQLDPLTLESTARDTPAHVSEATLAYLDSLTDRQRRDLAGVRDRLAIVAESDAGRWLAGTGGARLDLLEALRTRAVVYVRLDADRHPLLAQMLGAALVADLVTCVATLQREPTSAVVALDEFSALAAGEVSRLFGRARSAGVSLLLATQELADLRLAGHPGLPERVLGNVSAIVAGRQVVPESIDLIARIAGADGAWLATHQVGGQAAGYVRRRVPLLDPDELRRLPTGTAAVILPGAAPPAAARIARLCAPARVTAPAVRGTVGEPERARA